MNANEIIKASSDLMEKAIRETAEQGFNYMVVKRETIYKDNSATMKINCKGFYEISISTMDMFIELGYEIFNLDKVKEYLEQKQLKE